MSGRFLRTLFQMVELPPVAVNEIVAAYKSRYPRELTLNHSVGDSGTQLLGLGLSAEDLCELIGAGNYAVLDAVLDSRECRNSVTVRILDTWELSPRDQMRFINRRLGKETTDLLFDLEYVSREVLELVDEREVQEDLLLGRGFVYGKIDPLFDGPEPSPQTVLVHTEENWAKSFDKQADEVVGSMGWSVKELGSINGMYLAIVRRIGRSLSDCLNLDDTELTKRAWMLFLSLCEDDPDVTVGSVIATSKRLALAER